MSKQNFLSLPNLCIRTLSLKIFQIQDMGTAALHTEGKRLNHYSGSILAVPCSFSAISILKDHLNSTLSRNLCPTGDVYFG